MNLDKADPVGTMPPRAATRIWAAKPAGQINH
jgi:hypothetical protein